MISLDGIGKILGGATGGASTALVATYALFTPQDEYNRHVAESERGYILDVVEKARGEPDGDYKLSLCRTLDDAIGRLCAAAPDDAVCKDRAVLRERAGCR